MRIRLLALGVLVAVAGCGGADGDPLGEAAARMDGESLRLRGEVHYDRHDGTSEIDRGIVVVSADRTRSRFDAANPEGDRILRFTILTIGREAWMGGEIARDELVEAIRAGELSEPADMIPVEAWIGEDGRLLRLVTKTESEKGLMTITTDVLEYGVDADLQPPKTREVMTLAEYDALGEGQ